jgi:hypothetical protein
LSRPSNQLTEPVDAPDRNVAIATRTLQAAGFQITGVTALDSIVDADHRRCQRLPIR